MSGQDLQAVVDAGIASAEPSDLGDGRFVVVTPRDGSVVTIDPINDRFLDAPRRKVGTTVVHDVASLALLWDKAAAPGAVLFADEAHNRLTAVLNGDRDGDGASAGFGDHRIVLDLRHTEAWRRWMGVNGTFMSQTDFAELIEDRLIDIVEPAGAEMLELAQSFEASVSADFKSATPLASGARTLKFEETITARAGQTGEIEIPAFFVVALQPYLNGDAFRIKARFRYRLRNGNLSLAFAFERPEDVLREAFTETVTKAGEACSTVTVLGSPAAARV